MAETAKTKTKSKRQAKKESVTVVHQVTTAIQVGRDNYLLKGTEDGRGVNVQNEKGNLFIPYGDAGKAIVTELSKQIGANSGRKRRRTKAEILAANGGEPKGETEGEA
jgi:hypothetical protein